MMNTKDNKTFSFTATQLQLIAIIAMLCDHIGFKFFGDSYSIRGTGLVLHLIGRLTFPIMAYFIAEGYRKTSNIKKYLGRVFILAIISVIPFFLVFSSTYGIILQNTVFGLAFGLLALYLSDKTSNKLLRALIVITMMAVTIFADVGPIAVLMIYIFGRTEPKTKRIWLGFGLGMFLPTTVVTVLNALSGFPINLAVTLVSLVFELLIPGILLMCYNGKKGKKSRLSFYVVYPLHLMIIWAISLLIK